MECVDIREAFREARGCVESASGAASGGCVQHGKREEKGGESSRPGPGPFARSSRSAVDAQPPRQAAAPRASSAPRIRQSSDVAFAPASAVCPLLLVGRPGGGGIYAQHPRAYGCAPTRLTGVADILAPQLRPPPLRCISGRPPPRRSPTEPSVAYAALRTPSLSTLFVCSPLSSRIVYR